MDMDRKQSTVGLAVGLAGVLIAVGVTLAAVTQIMGTPPAGGSAAMSGDQALVGRPAPLFELRDLEENALTLADQRGQVVLLNFWATWCGPCRQELPHLQRLYDSWAASGLVVWGLSTDTQAAAVRGFVDQHDYSFPVALAADVARSQYGVRGIPATFLVDRGGIVRYGHEGFGPGSVEQLERELRELLDEEIPIAAAPDGAAMERSEE